MTEGFTATVTWLFITPWKFHAAKPIFPDGSLCETCKQWWICETWCQRSKPKILQSDLWQRNLCPKMSQDVPRLESTSLSQSDSFMGSDLPIRLHGLFGSQLSHHWLLFSCDPHGHGQHILLVPVVEGFGVRHLSFAKPNNDYKQQLWTMIRKQSSFQKIQLCFGDPTSRFGIHSGTTAALWNLPGPPCSCDRRWALRRSMMICRSWWSSDCDPKIST